MSGPLDELVDRTGDAVPRLPVHARVLDLPTVEGRVRAFACWGDPGGPRALFSALQARVEGSLLGELSETAAALVEADAEAGAAGRPLDVAPHALHLVVYAEVAEVDRAVAPFGFRRVPVDDPRLRGTLAALRHEWAGLAADASEHALADAPVSAFLAEVRPPPEAVRTVERGLRQAGVDDVWGADPGAPFARLAALLPRAPSPAPGGGRVADDASLDAASPSTLAHLDRALVPREPGVVRWVPPMVFQALCDAVGVVASRALGARVDWGVCAPDDETGLAPPAVFRVGGERFLAVGLELLRWCVMPLAEGEAPPSLADWAADAFGAEGAAGSRAPD